MNHDSWEDVGRFWLSMQIQSAEQDLTDATTALDHSIHTGDAIAAEDVRALREGLEQVQRIVEEHVVPLVDDDDLEEWGRRPRVVPYGRLAQWADSSWEDDRTAAGGDHE